MYLRSLLSEDAQCHAEGPTSLWRRLRTVRRQFSLKSFRKRFDYVWLRHFANIDAEIPLFPGAMDPLWL